MGKNVATTDFGSRCNIFFCGSGVVVYNFVAEIRSGGTGFRG